MSTALKFSEGYKRSESKQRAQLDMLLVRLKTKV